MAAKAAVLEQLAGWREAYRRAEATFCDSPVPPRCWVVVLAAVLLGALLRFWDLDGVPPGLQQDEAVYGYDAYSIFETGRDHHGHPFPFASLETFGDWSSSLLSFLMAPAVGIFGLDVVVLRSVTALAGTLTIGAVFLLGVVLFQRPAAGAAAAVLIAVSPLHVHLSRWAIIPSLAPAMVALALLAFAWAMRNRSERGFAAAALLAALTVASYYGMRLYAPLAVITGLLVFRHVVVRLRLDALIYAMLVFTAIAGPIIYLSLRDPGGGARFAQTSVFESRDVTPTLMAEQYASYFSPALWLSRGDGDTMHLPPGNGMELWTVAPLLVTGLGWLVVVAWRSRGSWDGKAAMLVLALIAFYPLPGSLTLPNPDILRASHVLPLAALASGAGAMVLADFARRAVAGLRVRARTLCLGGLALLFLLAVSVELTGRYREYFGPYRDEVAASFHGGLEDTLRFVLAEDKGRYGEVWVTPSVHAGYIYVLFYAAWEPSDVHRSLSVTRDPPEWNRVHSIGKYRFDEPPSVIQEGRVLHVSRLRDGSPAYLVVAAQAEDGMPVLVVRSALGR